MNFKVMLTAMWIIGWVVCMGNNLNAATINVPADQSTIQDGIDAAVNGDTVNVVAGIYFENINFSGKLITLKSLAGPENTTIDGSASGSVVSFLSGEDNNAKLEGFTVTNGSAASGGGIRIFSSSPTITNCIIRDNEANYGGGIDCDTSPSAVIESCTIKDNIYYNNGGGISCLSSSPTIIDCIIKGNNIPGSYAAFGGGIFTNVSSPTITNCSIEYNEGYYGGGIYCSYSSTPVINDSIIRYNDTASHGGGIVARFAGCSITVNNCVVAFNHGYNDGGGFWIRSDASALIKKSIIAGNRSGTGGGSGGGICNAGGNVTIDQCHILGNETKYDGGGVYGDNLSDLTIINSTISNNRLTNASVVGNTRGGGIFCYDADIKNCTVTGNRTTSIGVGGGIYVNGVTDIVNSILWGNTDGTGSNQVHSVVTTNITYSDIEGGWSGTGNINDDPLLIGTHLTNSSPCIDVGTATDAPTEDIDGDLRPLDTSTDMGSDEFSGGPATTLYVPTGYGTIQEAIIEAQDGDTVLVDSGTYYENIYFLGKAVTVKSTKGFKQATIDGGGNGSVVKILSGEDHQCILDGFTITNGYTTSAGGGILCMNYSSPTIKNCRIAGNHSNSYGSGIFLKNYSSPKIINTKIVNNRGYHGAGIYCNLFSSPDIINTTISGNYSSNSYGGGIYCYNYSSPNFINGIIWNNQGKDNQNEIYLATNGSITVSYSNIKGGYTGTGNIDVDPLFVDPKPPSPTPTNDGDYHLRKVSPCIDVGTSDTATYPDLPTNDIDGDERPVRDGYDMGADEYTINSPGLIDWNGDLLADFGEGDGLKFYNGSVWNDLTSWGSVNYLSARSTDLIVNFGNDRGIYTYDSVDWTKISGWEDTVHMTVWNDDLVVDFGQGRGIYTYDTAWTKFCGWDTTDRIVAWGTDLVIEFGGGRGTYIYNGSSFTKLCGWENTHHLLTWNDDLVVDFGQGRGIYTNNGSAWTKLCGWDTANKINAWNDKLVIDFGGGRGIFTYDGTWNSISGWDTVHAMTAWDTRLVVDYGGGRGLYTFDGTWNNISGWDDVEEMIVVGSDLVVDYGTGRGVYSYDGADWTKLNDLSTGD